MVSERQKLLTGLGRLNPLVAHVLSIPGGLTTVTVALKRPLQNDSYARITGVFTGGKGP
jgi:hypothetical protein